MCELNLTASYFEPEHNTHCAYSLVMSFWHLKLPHVTCQWKERGKPRFTALNI